MDNASWQAIVRDFKNFSKDRDVMSLDVEGFTDEIEGATVSIIVSRDHRLLRLARHLLWEEMLQLA